MKSIAQPFFFGDKIELLRNSSITVKSSHKEMLQTSNFKRDSCICMCQSDREDQCEPYCLSQFSRNNASDLDSQIAFKS